jgi:DNA-binding Xre family transcriptional regulator
MKKVELTTMISSASLKKLQNHEPVSLNVLMKISEALDVPIEKIVEFRRI